MTLNQLSYYTEVVRQKSFTKAAENLFVSQSTISKAIRVLESEFQVELIDRTAREFQLTDEGKIFYEYAMNILQYYNVNTQELYQRLHGNNGTLRLGLPPTAGTIYFFSLLYKFRLNNPGIDLKITEITSKYIKDMVETGELDLGIVIEPFEDEKFFSYKVYTSEAVVVVSKQHHLASKRSVAADKLSNERFLMVTPDYMFYDCVLDYCKSAGFDPNIVFESSQWDLLLEMVADNQGISILPKPIIEKCYNTRVHQLHLKKPSFPWTLTLIYRNDKFITDAMQHFLDLCIEQ
ncbi:LysR family transcriptional regulator [Clostridioides difficile]